MNNEIVIPPGYSPPFAVVTENDHTAWIIIAASLGLACTLLFGGIRILLRSTICPGVGLDDYLLGAATVLTIIQSSLILGASHNGLGKTIDLVPTATRVKVQQLYYGGTLLFIIALGLSKLSTIAFLLRLTKIRVHRITYSALAAVVTGWIIASFFAVALQCNLSRPWAVVGETCSGTLLRWQAIGAFDIITEVAMVAGSVFLVWGLQASLITKLIVVSTFSCRLLLVLPVAFRLSTFRENGRYTDFFLLEDLFVVWTQTELNYALISATIPMLRPLANNLNTQFGGLGEGESAYAYGSNSKSSNKDATSLSTGSYQMSNMRSTASQIEKTKANTTTVVAPNFSGNQDFYRCEIQAKKPKSNTVSAQAQGQPEAGNITGDARSVASNESQQQLMIRKDITYKVEHHCVE